MSAHLLDRPVWSALSTRHARFAEGDDRARRFAPDVGPFAASRDDQPDSLAALARLVPADGTVLLLQADPIVLPPGVVVVTAVAGVQMIRERALDAAGAAAAAAPDAALAAGIEPLTDADVPAMVALATLTRPGPFASRTAQLGTFWGVKEAGALIAMAGERMQQPGFTEVSGVCTHPDARGRGLARALSAHVASRIDARGETPYLHAYASNSAAIALYESLGFRVRRPMYVATVTRA